MRDGFPPLLTRFEIDEALERDGAQYLKGRGMAGEEFRNVLRIEPHGFASHPPKGSIGVAMQMGGRRDQQGIIGVEHPQHRPNTAPGCSYLYDAFGQIISVVEREIRMVANEKIHFVAPTIVLEGVVKLGSEGASRPASAQGTLDDAGHAETSNFATKVWME